jgi:hypothetical protein
MAVDSEYPLAAKIHHFVIIAGGANNTQATIVLLHIIQYNPAKLSMPLFMSELALKRRRRRQ